MYPIVFASLAGLLAAAPVQEAAPAKPAKPVKEKKICKSGVQSSASRLPPPKVCRTRAEWEALNGNSQGNVESQLQGAGMNP